MESTVTNHSVRVAVVGGGISGLTAAYKVLCESEELGLGIELRLFEAAHRFGGVIETISPGTGTGNFVMEAGPDSFFTEKKGAIELCQEVGLSEHLIATNEMHRRSLVAWQGKLHELPEGFVMIAPSQLAPLAKSALFSLKGKARIAMELRVPPRLDAQDESVESFVNRRLGPEVLERVAQAMVGGIYVGDVAKLSAEATLPRFVAMERNSGSIIKGLMDKSRTARGGGAGESGTVAGDSGASSADGTVSGARYSMFMTLDGGLSLLTEALKDRIGPDSLAASTEITSVFRNLEGRWQLQATRDLDDPNFDVVIFCLPSDRLSSMVGQIDANLSAHLASISFASSAVVNFVYKQSDMPHALDAFGFVVPALEKRSILAASFSSRKFPGRARDGEVVIRSFVGGVLNSEILTKSDDEIEDLVSSDLRLYLGVSSPPKEKFLFRYPSSMPQYNVGHFALLKRIESRLVKLPGIYLAGNSYDGVGIPDCIESALKAARAAIDHISRFKSAARA